MRKTIMKLLAATVVLAFLFPTTALGTTNAGTAKPKENRQSAAQLTPEQRQARREQRQERIEKRKEAREEHREQRREKQKERIREHREKQIAQQIARLEKVKAAMEKAGKTGDPKYQNVVDHIAKLQARLDKLSAEGAQ